MVSSVKGWEGAVKYANRIVGEAVGIGDNADTTWDLDFPAVDELGDVTDDPEKIEVFLDGVLKIPTTDYTLDGDGGSGSVGLITFTVAPIQDAVITANYYAYQSIGLIKSVSISHNNNVEAIKALNDGNRLPAEAKEGHIDISLSMTRCLIDLGLVSTVIHDISAARGWLASELFDIEVYPKGTTGGYPLYVVRGKFNNYTLDMPADGLLMDTVDMVGIDITLTVAA